MNGGQDRSHRSGWLPFAASFLAWPALYLLTLEVVGTWVSLTLRSEGIQGYWAFIGLMSATIVIPFGLVVSCIIYARWRRLSWFLALSALGAAMMALVPVVLGMVSYK